MQTSPKADTTSSVFIGVHVQISIIFAFDLMKSKSPLKEVFCPKLHPKLERRH